MFCCKFEEYLQITWSQYKNKSSRTQDICVYYDDYDAYLIVTVVKIKI